MRRDVQDLSCWAFCVHAYVCVCVCVLTKLSNTRKPEKITREIVLITMSIGRFISELNQFKRADIFAAALLEHMSYVLYR